MPTALGLQTLCITLKDFEKATCHPELDRAYTFKNDKHKVLFVYGEKIILVSLKLHKQFDTYIKYICSILVQDEYKTNKMQYIFTSFIRPNAPQNSHQMKHTNVSQCLTQTFDEAGVFSSSKTFNRVSPSRLPFSIFTEVVYLGEDNPDNIAFFAKHGKKVCKNCEDITNSKLYDKLPIQDF